MVVSRDPHVGRATAVVIWVAIALVLADVTAYVLIIRSQGATQPDVFTVPFVAGYLVLMAFLLWLSLLGLRLFVSLRPVLRAAAAAGLLLLGLIAAFSIGLPIVIAGVLATIAAVSASSGLRLRNAVLPQVAAALIAITVLVGGFELTERLIVCPATGIVGGGGSHFITGGYHYQCNNGVLTMYSGDCNGFSSGGVDANGNPISSNGC